MWDMKQFRIERDGYGALRIYCRDVPHWYGGYLERMVSLRHWNNEAKRYE